MELLYLRAHLVYLKNIRISYFQVGIGQVIVVHPALFSSFVSSTRAYPFIIIFNNLDDLFDLIDVVDSVNVRVDSVFADHIFFLLRSHVAYVSGIFEGAFAHESGALSAVGVLTIEQVEFVFFAPYLEVVAVRTVHSFIIRTHRLQNYVQY